MQSGNHRSEEIQPGTGGTAGGKKRAVKKPAPPQVPITQISDAIAKERGIPKYLVLEIIRDCFELVGDTVSRGVRVHVNHFGSFTRRKSGGVCLTGHYVSFRSSKKLKMLCRDAAGSDDT